MSKKVRPHTRPASVFEREHALKVSEENYRRSFNNARDAINIFSKDREILDVNAQMVKLSGYPKKELLSMKLFDLYPKSDAPESSERIKQLLAGKALPEFETILATRNGVEKTVEIAVTVLKNCYGRDIVFQSNIRDVSRRKKAELALHQEISKRKKARQELEEYRQHLEHLIEKKSADLGATQLSLEKAQSISHIGSWELDFSTRKVICSNEFFRIFRINKRTFDGRMETVLKNRIHPDEKERLPDMLMKLMEVETLAPVEFRICLPDGFTRFIRADSEPVPDSLGNITGIVGVAHDITERKQADDRIHASLEEKEVMLREIHHRSKNNMQVISSLLNLQARTADEKTLKVLKDSQNRIRSLALIHEKLYQSKDLGNVNIGDYVTTLIGDLFTSYGVESSRIKCVIEIKDIFLDLNRSIPCGLIINELVSNSLEHAFAETETGTIGISMAHGTDGRRIILEYKDTGKGLPETIDVKNSKTLGLKLVNTLATSQLKGKVEMSGREGTCIRIVFPH